MSAAKTSLLFSRWSLTLIWQKTEVTGVSLNARVICLPVLLALTFCGCTGQEAAPDPAAKAPSVPPKDARDPGRTTQRNSVETVAAFADMTAASGIDFQYRNDQESDHYSIVESLGGGVGLTDFDLDGDIDVFVPGGGHFPDDGTIVGLPSGLFRNQGDWKFSSVAAEAGVALAPWYSHGAAVSDINNDGFSDILVTGYGGLLMFQNQGDGTYLEISGESGLTDSLWSSSAACGDINGDGNPDIYVAHYVDWSLQNNPPCQGPEAGLKEVCPPRQFNPLPDTFYTSLGDGTFRDTTTEMPLRTDGKGLAVQMADVDLDGHLDIYVANDTVPNFLYRNTGDGHLDDTSTRSGTSLSDSGTPDGSMGVDVGDYNLDGRPDIWVANYERESFALYRNEGNFFFQHVSRATGVTAVGGLAVGWGTVFLDFDRDGDEDVFVSNGHVIRHPRNAPLMQPPLLFQNDNGRRFHNVAPAAGPYMTEPQMGRGVASGDLDNDGDQDLAISRVNQNVVLLSNNSGSNRSLVVRLIGTVSSRDAAGAVIRVTTKAGQPVMIRQIKGGGSYASTCDSRQFFGIGTADSVAEVTVRWPSGTEETLTNVSASTPLVLREPSK